MILTKIAARRKICLFARLDCARRAFWRIRRPYGQSRSISVGVSAPRGPSRSRFGQDGAASHLNSIECGPAREPTAQAHAFVPLFLRLQAVPQQKAALATMAAFAATVLLSAAPAQADAVKSAVCASNATAKICLKDSFKK